MPSLSIKDVPQALAEKLRQQATRHHRSLQGELMAILEAAVERQAGEARPLVHSPPDRRPPPTESTVNDGLLERLDRIVAGSQWGNAPVLTREQANERALSRELHYLANDEDAKRS